MLSTVFFLILCAVIALASLPLAMRLVPPNPYYGFRTERTMADPALWITVSALAGQLLVAAAGIIAIALMMYSGTWLRGFFAQLFMFLVPIGAALGAAFWFERHGGAWK